MNFANMPITLTHALKSRGYEAAHIQYGGRKQNALRYQLDRTVDIQGDGTPAARMAAQMRTLEQTLDEGFDIFHFWNRSLVFRTDYGGFSGLDLPLIKARGRKIGYRFTGFDLRLPSRDMAVNPHSAFRYDLQPYYDEALVEAYQDFLREYVDRFFVQDPELGQFFPEATVIPRALKLDEWDFVGVQKSDRPLVVHAPTNAAAKGTRFVLAAVEALKDRGLKFDFQLIQGMAHAEARAVYAKADIIVDQILIGATGVLTLEAWALGKPVVVNLRRDLFEPFYETNDLPIVNANPDNVTEELAAVIQDFEKRQDLARRGRALVEQRHDIANVIDSYITAYDEMHAAPPVQPTGGRDIAYLTMQLQRTIVAERFWTLWRARYRAAYRREAKRRRDLGGPEAPGPVQRVAAAIRSALPLVRQDVRNIGRKLLAAWNAKRNGGGGT